MIMCAENDADGKEKIKEETTQNKIDSPVSEVSSSNDSEKNHTFVRHTNKSHKLVLDDSKNQFSSSPCKNQKKNNIKNIVNKSSANIMVEHENISTTMSSLLNGSCPSRATTLQLCDGPPSLTLTNGEVQRHENPLYFKKQKPSLSLENQSSLSNSSTNSNLNQPCEQSVKGSNTIATCTPSLTSNLSITITSHSGFSHLKSENHFNVNSAITPTLDNINMGTLENCQESVICTKNNNTSTLLINQLKKENGFKNNHKNKHKNNGLTFEATSTKFCDHNNNIIDSREKYLRSSCQNKNTLLIKEFACLEITKNNETSKKDFLLQENNVKDHLNACTNTNHTSNNDIAKKNLENYSYDLINNDLNHKQNNLTVKQNELKINNTIKITDTEDKNNNINSNKQIGFSKNASDIVNHIPALQNVKTHIASDTNHDHSFNTPDHSNIQPDTLFTNNTNESIDFNLYTDKTPQNDISYDFIKTDLRASPNTRFRQTPGDICHSVDSFESCRSSFQSSLSSMSLCSDLLIDDPPGDNHPQLASNLITDQSTFSDHNCNESWLSEKASLNDAIHDCFEETHDDYNLSSDCADKNERIFNELNNPTCIAVSTSETTYGGETHQQDNIFDKENEQTVVSKGSKLDVLSGFGENSTCNSNVSLMTNDITFGDSSLISVLSSITSASLSSPLSSSSLQSTSIYTSATTSSTSATKSTIFNNFSSIDVSSNIPLKNSLLPNQKAKSNETLRGENSGSLNNKNASSTTNGCYSYCNDSTNVPHVGLREGSKRIHEESSRSECRLDQNRKLIRNLPLTSHNIGESKIENNKTDISNSTHLDISFGFGLEDLVKKLCPQQNYNSSTFYFNLTTNSYILASSPSFSNVISAVVSAGPSQGTSSKPLTTSTFSSYPIPVSHLSARSSKNFPKYKQKKITFNKCTNNNKNKVTSNVDNQNNEDNAFVKFQKDKNLESLSPNSILPISFTPTTIIKARTLCDTLNNSVSGIKTATSNALKEAILVNGLNKSLCNNLVITQTNEGGNALQFNSQPVVHSSLDIDELGNDSEVKEDECKIQSKFDLKATQIYLLKMFEECSQIRKKPQNSSIQRTNMN